MTQLKGQLAYRVVRLFGRLPLATARNLGAGVGRLLLLWGNNPLVTVTRRNIALCLPQLSATEQANLVRKSVQETCKFAFESAVVWRMDNAQLDALIHRVQGLDHLLELQAQQKGLLILGPHLGNWEVLGRYITRLGTVVSMFQPPRLQELGQLIHRGREQSGATLVPTDRRGLTAVLTALKKGNISGVLPDQTPKDDSSGMFAPFFGHPAFTMTLVQKLVQHTQCRVVFGYAKRIDTGFEIHFLPAPDDIYAIDTAIAVAALNAGVENCVKEVPEQYQWEYKRFKKRPVGESGVY